MKEYFLNYYNQQEIDSSEKIGLKDCMYVFKTESTIRKKDIVSKYFILKDMKHQYVKNTYFNAYFVLIENNTKKTKTI